jgi:hypothetical protein
LAAAAIKHETSPEQPDAPVDAGKAKVAYVEPNSEVNPEFKMDGKTYRWHTPAKDRTIQIEEDGHGGLEAETADGSPVDMDLRLPAKGTQTEGSPQQAADPNASVQTKLPQDARWENTVGGASADGISLEVEHYVAKGKTIDIVEDGHGGLEATTQYGSPVETTIHLPTSESEPKGHLKNGNLAPMPPDVASGPNPPPDGTLREVK